MALPYDVSRCGTKGCPLAETCRRKELGHPTYQSYTLFPGGEDCYGYWPRPDSLEEKTDDE